MIVNVVDGQNQALLWTHGSFARSTVLLNRYSGGKLVKVPTRADGRIIVDSLIPLLRKPYKFPHTSKACAVSVTQPTEAGFCYSLEEVRTICSEVGFPLSAVVLCSFSCRGVSGTHKANGRHTCLRPFRGTSGTRQRVRCPHGRRPLRQRPRIADACLRRWHGPVPRRPDLESGGRRSLVGVNKRGDNLC